MTLVAGSDVLPREMIIDITAGDIQRGRPGSPTSCPVSVAMRRILGERGYLGPFLVVVPGACPSPTVRGDSIRVLSPGPVVVDYALPPALREWLGALDRLRDVGPITVVLRKIIR